MSRESPELLFSSYHNYLDVQSGASISTRATLSLLSQRGWRVRTLCGAFFDGVQNAEEAFYSRMRRLGLTVTRETYVTNFDGKSYSFRLFHFNDGGIESTFFLPADSISQSAVSRLSRSSGTFFLDLLAKETSRRAPDVYASYGGYWAAKDAVERARSVGARSVFLLHNLSYHDGSLFKRFDKVVVPSEFARRSYHARLGFDSVALPPLVDERLVCAKRRQGNYVVFINPSPEKGLNFFLGLARDLARRRPEIPLLIVESRAHARGWERVPFVRDLRNLNVTDWVEDVRLIYGSTRVLLFPSVCEETFGRVALEAAFNGVPVLCSDRGATRDLLTELGCGAYVLPIPARLTPSSRDFPTATETSPWLDALIELWDAPDRAREVGATLQSGASAYGYDQVARRTLAFFDSLLS